MAKFYVSMYEEYPIYEPAEGGYYYAGRRVVDLEDDEYNSIWRAIYEARQFVAELVDSGEDWIGIGLTPEELEATYNKYVDKFDPENVRVLIAYRESKYIGEGAEVYIESPEAYRKGESGWHPYE